MTVQELIEELMQIPFPREENIVLVIDDGPAQMVCSGDLSIERGDNPNEVIITGDDDG